MHSHFPLLHALFQSIFKFKCNLVIALEFSCTPVCTFAANIKMIMKSHLTFHFQSNAMLCSWQNSNVHSNVHSNMQSHYSISILHIYLHFLRQYEDCYAIMWLTNCISIFEWTHLLWSWQNSNVHSNVHCQYSLSIFILMFIVMVILNIDSNVHSQYPF